jgi:hypothetical protein
VEQYRDERARGPVLKVVARYLIEADSLDSAPVASGWLMDWPLAGSKKCSREVSTASSSGCPDLAPDGDDTRFKGALRAGTRHLRSGPACPAATSSHVLPVCTLAGRSGMMSEPGHAAASPVLTRILRRSPVRVSGQVALPRGETRLSLDRKVQQTGTKLRTNLRREAPCCIPGVAGMDLEDIPGSDGLPGSER